MIELKVTSASNEVYFMFTYLNGIQIDSQKINASKICEAANALEVSEIKYDFKKMNLAEFIEFDAIKKETHAKINKVVCIPCKF